MFCLCLIIAELIKFLRVIDKVYDPVGIKVYCGAKGMRPENQETLSINVSGIMLCFQFPF